MKRILGFVVILLLVIATSCSLVDSNLFSNDEARKPDADKNNGNAYGIGNGHAYGNANGNGHSYGWGNGYDGNHSSDIELPLLPIFRQSDQQISYSEADSSRAIQMIPDNEAEMYGTIFLPIMTGFIENTAGFTVGDLITTDYNGILVEVQTSIDELGDITYFFDLGETEGNITVVLHPDNTFDYYQNVYVCFWDSFYYYIFSELSNGTIFPLENIYAYDISGDIYWMSLGYDSVNNRSYINGQDLAKGSIRVKTNEIMSIGSPVLRQIDYNTLPSDIPSSDDFFINNKTLDDIGISELLVKKDFVKTLQYDANSSGYPLNDLYYVIPTNEFFYYLADDDNNYVSEENFQLVTGYSFDDLGYGYCSNLFEFFAEYFSLSYTNFKPDSDDIWRFESYELYNSFTDFKVIDLTINDDGIYYIGTKVLGLLFDEYGEIVGYSGETVALTAGHYDYAIRYEEEDFVYPDYLYLIRLEDI
jgi:hypothetical protein